MAQSILIFDFGTNEEAVQQARHKVETWKQAFRLGDKILLKFEREEPAEKEPSPDEPAAAAFGKAKSGGKKPAGKSAAKPAAKPDKEESKEPPARVRLFVRLAFSDHEKLSHQRWLDRIRRKNRSNPRRARRSARANPHSPRRPRLLNLSTEDRR
jgi:hypothetical protein